MDGPLAQGFLGLTAFQAEGCGGGFAADYKKGGAAGAAGCIEGLHRFAQGATALRAEGCGIAPWAMSFISRLRRSRQHRVSILSAYLVHPFPLRGTSPQGETRALRDLLFCIIWHDKHSADWLAALASPYPASPDFSTGKRVTRFSGRFASLRIVFPCHPCSGGRIKL